MDQAKKKDKSRKEKGHAKEFSFDDLVLKNKSTFPTLKESAMNKLQKDMEKKKPLIFGEVSSRLEVPKYLPKPVYDGPQDYPGFMVFDEIHISRMKKAGEIATMVMNHASTLVKPSVMTDFIDKEAHLMMIYNDAYPSLLGNFGFPKSLSTSVNECITNGIPDSRQLQAGDIISIGVRVFFDGCHAESTKTFFCGNPSRRVNQFVKACNMYVQKAVAICKAGTEFKKVDEILSECADTYKYGVMKSCLDYGIGKLCPTGSQAVNSCPGKMMHGQIFTIGLALARGGSQETRMSEDGYAVLTADGSWAAKFKNTILVTSTGASIIC